ncbi:MAG: hypothetical protein COU47_04240 [Candidatus Niyogibacteria bacterium CG10_big_fil_rev_8_21_14_0_10_46_36]|uniref:histidine kinase n=1 Tax=Candidatus Niyogibacteria bacterium CG10_big_fil_rev_8_21_14_0_10_46_36 TaxID=1974726 RepID=A0A2H0TE85_9BACT|nr:MAG: hypothetical protein COU47_04240 [Candidatus Niyogibacteria bacterium CG10_big_fil_rev_8_21_14_0_10_46_36]
MENKSSSSIFDSLNIRKTCDRYRVGLWQCPQFLFIIMGFVIIVAIIFTNLTARLYTEPEVAALIVLVVTALLFSVGTVLVRAFEEIAEASVAKSEFISVVSHEMRNPLSTVKWQLNLLEKTSEELANPELTESLATIQDQNTKAIRLVNELIEVYRIEDNKVVVTPAPFSLATLTEKTLNDFEHFAKALNINMSLMAASNLPLVFADRKKIEVAIGHLLDNAIQYSEEGGEITITIQQKGSFVIWTVSDQGVGIPKEELDLVFGKFFRAHNKLRYHTSGLGLGLYLVRSLIELSGGQVRVQSQESKGTTIWFSLPISPLGEGDASREPLVSV